MTQEQIDITKQEEKVAEVEALERLSTFLSARAQQMKVSGFTLNDVAFDLPLALDQEGPLMWALCLHSKVLADMAGVPGMPLTSKIDADALFGNRAGIRTDTDQFAKSNALPISFSYLFVDAALEHAIVQGLRDMGCTHEEWLELSEDLRYLPCEAYYKNMEQWVRPELEHRDPAVRTLAFPELDDLTQYAKESGIDVADTLTDKIQTTATIGNLVPLTPDQQNRRTSAGAGLS